MRTEAHSSRRVRFQSSCELLAQVVLGVVDENGLNVELMGTEERLGPLEELRTGQAFSVAEDL